MVINISIGELLGIVSGIVLLVSAFFILRQVKMGLSTPNLTTWMIGMLVGLINAFSFYKIVQDNIYQGFIMFASLITLVIIFFYSLSRGKFAKIKTFDVVLLFLAVFIGVLWKFTDNYLTNFLVQIVICIANSATIIGLWRGYLREYYFSWIWAVSAYIIAIIGLIIDFKGDWLPFFGPILNGVVCNGLVLLLSLKNKKIGIIMENFTAFQKILLIYIFLVYIIIGMMRKYYREYIYADIGYKESMNDTLIVSGILIPLLGIVFKSIIGNEHILAYTLAGILIVVFLFTFLLILLSTFSMIGGFVYKINYFGFLPAVFIAMFDVIHSENLWFLSLYVASSILGYIIGYLIIKIFTRLYGLPDIIVWLIEKYLKQKIKIGNLLN